MLRKRNTPDSDMTVLGSSMQHDRATYAADKTCSATVQADATDFRYSQRLYHGPNGNLFSVLSPAHRRTFSMKPNFLCRQPRGAGAAPRQPRSRRGGGHRCLKFHNFIPSESITSEKDDGSHDDVWKVHAECKLQEEHGTKQIMVSQWSVSSDTPSATPEVPSAASPDPQSHGIPPNHAAPLSHAVPPLLSNICQEDCGKGFKSPRYGMDGSTLSGMTPLGEELSRPPSGFVAARDELFSELPTPPCGCDAVLDRGTANSSPTSPTTQGESEILLGFLSKKHRRKPTQTRRVVPYKKYLSLLEDDTSATCPLDLSLKTRTRASPSEDEVSLRPVFAAPGYTQPFPLQTQPYLPYQNHLSNVQCFEKSPLQVALEAPLSNPPGHRLFSAFPVSQAGSPMSAMSGSQRSHLPTQLPFGYALYSAMESQNQQLRPGYPSEDMSNTRSALMAVLQNCRGSGSTSASSSVQAPLELQQHRGGSVSGLRKPSQRSLIKQKLEDTFKQNGFLVKTKQISDGDATFCKFRQLRKYTRYYLKSWHHHLPAEVHKLWKGFLPPKTLQAGGAPAGEDVPVSDDVTE